MVHVCGGKLKVELFKRDELKVSFLSFAQGSLFVSLGAIS